MLISRIRTLQERIIFLMTEWYIILTVIRIFELRFINFHKIKYNFALRKSSRTLEIYMKITRKIRVSISIRFNYIGCCENTIKEKSTAAKFRSTRKFETGYYIRNRTKVKRTL